MLYDNGKDILYPLTVKSYIRPCRMHWVKIFLMRHKISGFSSLIEMSS